jgi:hypothetical protein
LLLLLLLLTFCPFWGMDGPEFESGQGQETSLFSKTSRPALGPTRNPPPPNSANTGQHFYARFEVEQLHYVRQFSGSSLGPETGKPDNFCDFIQSLQYNIRTTPHISPVTASFHILSSSLSTSPPALPLDAIIPVSQTNYSKHNLRTPASCLMSIGVLSRA